MWSRILLIFSLAAALPAWAQTLAETLPNGMKVIVKEDARAPVAVAQLWYRVGSADEVAGKTGLSHALEHMMFKGTPSVPSGEFSRRVSALGGQNNAYTNRHETVYFETVAAANLPEVLKMEADRMANLNFSNQDFANEMSVIREERRQRTEDSPGGKLWEQLYLSSFQTDANRAPIIGYMADLHALKAADLRRWYRRWYAPNNAVLVIVGDVDAAQTLRTVPQSFGPIHARTWPAPHHPPAEPQVRAPARAETRAVTHQPLLALGYRVPALEKLDDTLPYALDVLADILSGNSASRLDKNLVRGKEAALDVGASYDMFSRGPALFTLVAMPADRTDVAQLQKLLEAEIADIARHGISNEELARVHTRMAASVIYARDSMSAQASLMGQLQTRGFSYRDEAELRRRLQSVDAAQVQAAARLLTPERQTVVVVQPE